VLHDGYGSSYYQHIGLLQDLKLMPDIPVDTSNTIFRTEVENNSIADFYRKICDCYKKMLTEKKDYIYLTGTKQHQIAFLITNKGDAVYLSLINSGSGIDNHYNTAGNYNLWHTYKLPDESDEDMLEDLIFQLSRLDLFGIINIHREYEVIKCKTELMNICNDININYQIKKLKNQISSKFGEITREVDNIIEAEGKKIIFISNNISIINITKNLYSILDTISSKFLDVRENATILDDKIESYVENIRSILKGANLQESMPKFNSITIKFKNDFNNIASGADWTSLDNFVNNLTQLNPDNLLDTLKKSLSDIFKDRSDQTIDWTRIDNMVYCIKEMNYMADALLESNNLQHDILINQFYKILTRIFKTDPVDTIGTIFDADKINKFVNLWDVNKSHTDKKSQIYERYIISDDRFLLTAPQKSGSCVWFSLFWGIIAHLLITKSAEYVVKYINKLDTKFMKILYKLFKGDSLFSQGKEFQHPYYTLNNLIIDMGLVNTRTSAEKMNSEVIKSLMNGSFSDETTDTGIISYYNSVDYIKECLAVANNIRNISKYALESEEHKELKKQLGQVFKKYYYSSFDKHPVINQILCNLCILYAIYTRDSNMPDYRELASFSYKKTDNLFVLLTKKEYFQCTNFFEYNKQNSQYTEARQINTDKFYDIIEKIPEIINIGETRVMNIIESIPFDSRVYPKTYHILFKTQDIDIKYNKKLVIFDNILYNKGNTRNNTLYPFNAMHGILCHDKKKSINFFQKILKTAYMRSTERGKHSTILINNIVECAGFFNSDIYNVYFPFHNKAALYFNDENSSKIGLHILNIYNGGKVTMEDLIKSIKAINVSHFEGGHEKISHTILDLFKPTSVKSVFIYNDEKYNFIETGDLYTYFGFCQTDADSTPLMSEIAKRNAIFRGKNDYIFVMANLECDGYTADYAKYNVWLRKGIYIIKYSLTDKEWTVNGHKAYLNPSINKFPFMVFAPCNCLKLVYETDEGDFNLLAWGCVNDKPDMIFEPRESFNAIDLKISSNMFSPILDTRSLDALKSFYKYHGAYDIALNSFNISQKIWSRLPDGVSKRAAKFLSKKEGVCSRSVPKITWYSWNYMKHDIAHSNNMPLRIQELVKKIKTNIFINHDTVAELYKRYNREHIDAFLHRNPVIHIRKGEDISLNEIKLCIRTIKQYTSDLIQNLIYVINDSMLNFMYVNAGVLLKIIQSNMMLNHLNTLYRIFNEINNNGKTLDEFKFVIFESTSLMDIPTIPDVHVLLYMIFFGYLFTSEQIDRYNSMIKSMHNDRKIFPVHHFMMGKGKSSVITPLIAINAQLSGKKFYIVVPSHLLKQTNDTFSVIKTVFNLTHLDIITDNTAKLKLINNEFDSEIILILDEVDMMLNPLQSTFQLIVPPKAHLPPEKIDELLRILMSLHDMQSHSGTFFSKELEKIYTSRYIKNIDYGMSVINKKNNKGMYSRTVIPYARKDSPLEGSEFCSLNITAVLTFKYFYETLVLESRDFYNICITRDNDIISKISTSMLDAYNDIDDFILDAAEKYILLDIPRKKEIIYLYLKRHILSSIEITEDKKNCSMVDIIGMNNVHWGIGYSGTVDIDLPLLDDDCKGFNKDIVSDPDEYISLDLLFTCGYENTLHNTFETIVDENGLWDRLATAPRYSALIDLAGLLKDHNNYDIIQRVSELYGQTDRSYIYLDEDDNKKIYDNYGTRNYNGQEFFSSEKVFYYYSQKNTVGVDFKQPAQMKCIIVINKHNTITETAQAIWRARKMIRGHSVTVLVVDTESNPITGSDILQFLKENSANYRGSQKGLLDYQNIKWLTRRHIQDTDQLKYQEQSPPIKYITERRPTQDEIIELSINTITTNHSDLRGYLLDHQLFKNFIKRSNLESIVIGNNSTETVLDVDIEVDSDINSMTHIEENKYMKPPDSRVNILPWCFESGDSLSDDISRYTNTLTQIDKYGSVIHIVYSAELFSDIRINDNILPDIGFIRIQDNKYMIAHSRMMRYYYNKFPIYNVFGRLINVYMFGKTHNTPIEFPKFIQLIGGYMAYSSERELKMLFNENEKLRVFVILLIKYGLVIIDRLKLFDKDHIDEVDDIQKYSDIADLITETYNACNENTDLLCNRIIGYGKDKTDLGKTIDEGIDDIIAMHQPPEIVMHGGSVFNNCYKQYMRVKNRYLKLVKLLK
jgi:hypothetical protein